MGERKGEKGYHDSYQKTEFIFLNTLSCLSDCLPKLESFSCRQNILVSKQMVKGKVKNCSHCKSQVSADCEISFLFCVNFLSPHGLTR